MKRLLISLGWVLSTSIAQAAPLSMEAGLRNFKLDTHEGDTYMRVTVHAAPQHLEHRLPMNIAVVIDRSGSMAENGPSGTEKMGDAKRAARFLIDQLDERDRLAVVSFDDGAEVLFATASMTAQNKAAAKERIGPLYARGSTDMVSGLRTGIHQVQEGLRADCVNRVILISDGVPNVEEGLVELAREAQSRGIGVSTLGVGLDYNEDLMTRLANAGNGGYYFVADASKLRGIFTRELSSLMAVVAKDAALKIELASGTTPIRVYGYDAQVGREATLIRLGDLHGGQTAEVLLKLHHPALSGEHVVAQVELMYRDAASKETMRLARQLAATFVEDEKQVEASLDPVTCAKAEQVATAESVNQAMDAYARGDREEAQKVLLHQRAALGAAPAPALATPQMARALKSLDFAAQAVAGAPAASMGYAGGAGANAAAKSAKADARELER